MSEVSIPVTWTNTAVAAAALQKLEDMPAANNVQGAIDKVADLPTSIALTASLDALELAASEAQADATNAKTETDRLKQIKPDATVDTLSSAITLAGSGNMLVGDVVKAIDSGAEYQLLDAGSSGARPNQITGYITHITGGSGGLYLLIVVRNAVIDVAQFGAGSGDSYAAITNAVAALKAAGGGRLIFSKNATPYTTSNQILIDFSNVKVELYSPLVLTKTTKSSALKISGVSSSNMIENITVQMFEGAYIDGNGQNITGYTYDLDDTEHCGLLLKYVRNYKVLNSNCKNGLISSFKALYSLSGLISGSQFSGAIHDNGVSITRDSLNYSETDPDTWANVLIENCKSYDNKDFGFTAFDSSNVFFVNCRAWGNGSDLDHEGNPGGGGFSYEDDNITPNVKNYNGSFINCRSYNSINAGILITASGVVVDKDCIFENVTTTWAGANPQFYGNGAYLIDSKNIVFNGWARKCSRAGLYAIGTSADGFIDAEIGGRFSENGYQSILMNGVNNIKLLPTLETSKAGETSSIASVEINNLSLNPNEGVVKVLGGWHQNNPNTAVSINKVRYAMVDGVAGLNNSLLSNNAQIIVKNTADARVCSIDMPSSGTPFYTASCEATCTTARMFDISGPGTIAPYVNSATNKNMFGGSLVTASAWADAVAQGQFINLQTRLNTAGILQKT